MYKLGNSILAVFLAIGCETQSETAMNGGNPDSSPIRVEAESEQETGAITTIVPYFGTQDVCAGNVPPGWIVVNDRWDPTSCGSPSTITYNVWTITRYDNEPIGAVMRACTGVVPGGWVVVNFQWDPTACGHPSSISDNVMTIQRLN